MNDHLRIGSLKNCCIWCLMAYENDTHMSKLIYVVSRGILPSETEIHLRTICKRLASHDEDILPPVIRVSSQISLAITCPSASNLLDGFSTALGAFFEHAPEWNVPKSRPINGTYMLVRSDDDCVEVVSDAAASRTVWTYVDKEKFVCSTSQRALLMYLGSFDFDRNVIPWILATGTLGPELSWDQRLRRLPPDSILRLDRKNWSTSLRTNEVSFEPVNRTIEGHRQYLRAAIESVFSSKWSYAPTSMVVPLSGGYDSRTILSLMKRGLGSEMDISTITWGTESRRKVLGSDAVVAAEVSNFLDVPNQYIPLDETQESIGTVLNRFIACSEGRIDHISGYIDGMALWRSLRKRGVDVIVRGDEGFGWMPTSTDRALRYSLGMGLSTDYANIECLLDGLNLPQSKLPNSLTRRSQEPMEAWRDRLYHSFRIPTILAALSDVKLSYVEIINPFLASTILRSIRTIPGNLRNSKSLFKDIASELSPNIPYATSAAIMSPRSIIDDPAYKSEIVDRLNELEVRESRLPTELYQLARAAFARQSKSTSREKISNSRRLSSLFPKYIRNRARDFKAARIEERTLALRIFLMCSLLSVVDDDIQYCRRSIVTSS
jgi:hypothetical protein